MQNNLLKNIQDKKVFITGASSGIGLALSKLYLKKKWIVFGLGRDSSKIDLDIKSNKNFNFLECDLTNFSKTKSILNKLFSDEININTFILNAGIYIPNSFKDFNFDNAKKSFDTNVLSIYQILELIKNNYQLGSHHTLAIMSSTAGYKGLPRSLLYGPTKAALINLTESLKSELHNDLNIKLICPGFVETPATKINSFKMPFLMSSDKAANEIFENLYKKGFEITFPFPFNSIMKFGKILPYKLYFRFTKKQFSKK